MGIDVIEWVTALAVRLLSSPFVVGLRQLASLVIFSIGDGIKVLWIHASRRAAQMVKDQSRRDWAFPMLVGNAMRQCRAALSRADLETSVTGFIAIGRPDPTAGRLACELRGESIQGAIGHPLILSLSYGI